MPANNVELMARARVKLASKWGDAAVLTLLYFVVSALASAIPLGGIVVGGPLLLGYYLAILDTTRGGAPRPGRLFDGFKRFVDAFVASLLMGIFVLLWSLLLIVPGVMALFSYSQTYFILADNENMEALEAIRRSKAMMAGHRWQLSWLWGRFFGWFVLGILSLGIGFLWIFPYFVGAQAEFYEDLKAAQTPA